MSSNNYKYFRRPIIPFLVPKTQNVNIPEHFNHDILNDVVRDAQKQCYAFSPKIEPYKNVGTQTDYRDSESQTVPWEPPYRIKTGHNPEVLTIAHLTWNHGLPAGLREIEIISRVRMKKAWEEILPPMDTSANIKLRTTILTALEVDEWAFRESEIQAIMDYRFELMSEISKSLECEKRKKAQDRFNRLKIVLSDRRDKEVNSIKHNLRRELRKLRKTHHQKQRPARHDIIKEHADAASEIYAPQMRYGEHPQRRHEVIQKELLRGSYIESIDQINTLPSWLPTYEELRAIKPKPKPTDLCIRETRWTEEKLRQLHSDLKVIRLNVEQIETSTLLKRKYKAPSLPPTPYNTTTGNAEHVRIDQLSTLMQKIVRGRALQCMMFEGRSRCRELIEELQSSHGLEDQSKKQRQKEKEHMIDLQRLQNEKSTQENRLYEILNSLEGISLTEMLDFLSKELIRLEDERRIHAFTLLAERERAMKEAAEAGRRQLEYNRRREFDEMFKQIVKVQQESVETYLEDIIKEGIEWVSDEAAKKYILKLCDKVDDISKYAQDNATRVAEEELVANMIYNFVLPEVEKSSTRKSIREKQQSYLRNAHEVLYDEILNLPSIENLNSPSNEICRETCDKMKSINILDTEKISKACSTADTAEEQLESLNLNTIAVKDVKAILESIISNVVPVCMHI
ncbi:cilia- and flagella-associated protein 91-like isoform X1 [Hylaeus volcanicus]|uniref:cilia- and flagella-associated protein 91-like isoform X1 n=1 Tax=Hylaeus volcanicus TaxID=313075 RepID=UPI0023B7C8F0|nr:cilia- and flagella-associated protein 91-like isoform X1 [Hylaeus volcanicus]XP_053989190.1 cilia- and flagella-associated protein 91-like isoform X1 [Hylaeus volcanicus]XP_053989196.1 cilia- and flagella-associated protein 91-like isoform X1 [Hylaeus volcanicus]